MPLVRWDILARLGLLAGHALELELVEGRDQPES